MARQAVVLGTFLLSLLLYIDRVCISVAEGPISEDLRFDKDQMSLVMSAFALGYALFQVPGGLMADRLGPRRMLSAIVVVWSAFTALTGAVSRLGSMLVARFLFGAGEAGAYPGVARAFYSWLPVAERGLAQGLNFSGSRLGAAIALPGMAWLIDAVGWRASFWILGGIGVVWAVAWYALFRDTPEGHPGVSERERAFIRERRGEPLASAESRTSLSAARVLSSGNMWLLMGQYFASNVIFFFCLTWFFPYLKSKYGLESGATAWYASLPFLAGMVGHWVAGALVDLIYRKGAWRASRQVPAIIGFTLAALGVVMSMRATGIVPAISWFSLAIFGADMTISPSWSVCIDIGREHSGAISGTMNMAGNIGSFVSPLLFTGLASLTGTEDSFFVVAAALNVLAIVGWLFIRPDRLLR